MKRVAVIGTGYLGKFHAEKYFNTPKADLVAVVDSNLENLVAVGAKYQVKQLQDFRQLKDLNIDCASIVTNTSSHYEIAKWCLENSIDILLEKPITSTVQQAVELVEISKKNNRILQIGHLERFNPAFKAIQGQLNQPKFFEVRRICSFSGRGLDVDVVIDLMIHDLDIVSFLANSEIKKIDAVGVSVISQGVDIANARLVFTNGAIANLTASRVALNSERTMKVFQPDVYISVDYEHKKIRMCTRPTEDKPKLGVPSPIPGIYYYESLTEQGDALASEIDAFLDCVNTRAKPLVTPEDGMKALFIAQQIQEAIKLGDSLLL